MTALSFGTSLCFHFIPECIHINGPYEDTDFVGVSHRCGEFYGHIPFHYVRIGRNDPLLTAENIQIFYNENCYMIQAFGTYFETILINNGILTS